MKKIPRLRFAHLPTPVEPLPTLSAFLQGPSLWIKRDDQTGLAFGGNKTRKLEYLLAEAQAHGADTLITTGAVQSNHCRQTAAAAARSGLACILVLAGDRPESASGNLALDRLLGAEIVWGGKGARDEALQETFDRALRAGRRPYLIPYGGSSPIGVTAYVSALEELHTQRAAFPGGQLPDWIVFASSSGGTQAGLALGAACLGYRGRILGISVDETADILQSRVQGLANETAEFLNEPASILADDILVNDAYLGGGYGVMGEPEVEALQLFASREGILLDPVYTGRAAAGLIDLIRRGFFRTDQTILFWHTGGTPALFAGQYQPLFKPDHFVNE